MTIINKNDNSNNGIGFFGLLQIIFIVLKIFNVIKWSWWLVFMPFYVWLLIFILVIVLAIIFG